MSGRTAASGREVGVTDFEVSVQDPAVLAEIELYGEMVVAATDSAGPLPQQEIDRLLGLTQD